MEENKVATDSSAANSPELTRLSGEQAEERTAREGRLFGYKCQTCHKGTVKEKLLENFQTKIGGLPVSIPLAKVGECDLCGARMFNAKEVKRWKTIAGR